MLGLGKDASYLFEMFVEMNYWLLYLFISSASFAKSINRYHATNESYRFLNNYFIGTLDPQDAALVPPSTASPSDAFLTTLRSFLAKDTP